MNSAPNIKALSASEKDELILQLWAKIEPFQVHCLRITERGKENAELKSKLAKNSRNSSKPPSSDGYGKPQPKSQRKKTGRPSGGQPGHKGGTLRQVDHPHKIHDHRLSECQHCHADLSTQAASEYEARQVFDLPAIKIAVTEHRAEIKDCPYCRNRIRADFPAEVTQAVQYGHQLQAITTYLSHYQLLPYKRLQELLSDLFQVEMSQGTVNRMLHKGYDQLEDFECTSKEKLRESDVLHFDESGVRVKKR